MLEKLLLPTSTRNYECVASGK